MDDLLCLALLGGEGRAQRLVTRDDESERALERVDIQISLHPDEEGDVVGAPRLEAIEEPQPLLGEGGRKREDVVFVRGRVDRRLAHR